MTTVIWRYQDDDLTRRRFERFPTTASARRWITVMRRPDEGGNFAIIITTVRDAS